MAVFEPFRRQLDECKRAKSFESIPDAELESSPWIGADLQTMGGHTGFATMFSRKTRGDPCAVLVHRVVFHRGDVFAIPASAGVSNPKPFLPVGIPHEPDSLKPTDALQLLYHGCCSAPKRYMTRLTDTAEKFSKTQQTRTAAKHHAVSGAVGGGRAPLAPLGGVGGGSSSGSPLPSWIRSVMAQSAPGYTERRDSAQSYLKELLVCMTDSDDTGADDAEDEEGCRAHKKARKCVDNSAWIALHIDRGAMPCPMQLSQDPPVRHHHRNNGIILAVNIDSAEDVGIVYARCSACRNSPTTNSHVERVASFKGAEYPSPWIRLSKESFEAMLRDSGETVQCLCVCSVSIYLLF